jgi:mono/diheme cytochrome c family protein
MRRVLTLLVSLLGGLLIAGLAAVAYARVTGLSALDQPGSLEATLARWTRSFAVPAEVRNRKNPVPGTEAERDQGMAHFADHCASCHGNDGSGETPLGRSLYPPAPDMRLPATQQLTDGELFWAIEEGIRLTGMPGWSTRTEEGARDSWRLVHFIRHLPSLSDEELAEMSALNPKPPDEIRQALEEERFLQGEAPP